MSTVACSMVCSTRSPARRAHQDDAARIRSRDRRVGARRTSCGDSTGNAARCPPGEKPEQHQRRQDAIQIQQAEHAPVECGLGARSAFELAVQNARGPRGGFALIPSLIQNSVPRCDRIGMADKHELSASIGDQLTGQRRLRCVMAQLNLVVGDVDGNTSRIIAAAVAARDEYRRGCGHAAGARRVGLSARGSVVSLRDAPAGGPLDRAAEIRGAAASR